MMKLLLSIFLILAVPSAQIWGSQNTSLCLDLNDVEDDDEYIFEYLLQPSEQPRRVVIFGGPHDASNQPKNFYRRWVVIEKPMSVPLPPPQYISSVDHANAPPVLKF